MIFEAAAPHYRHRNLLKGLSCKPLNRPTPPLFTATPNPGKSRSGCRFSSLCFFAPSACRFCLSAAFVLAKFVRDQEAAQQCAPGEAKDTPMFKLVVWGGFALAMSLTGWGLWRMEVNETYKAFLGVTWLYLITCTFTPAKTLRDRHEADVLTARLARRNAAASADAAST